MLDLLDAILETWARSNTILLNLLQMIPAEALSARAAPDSPTVAQMFHHLHHERMISILEEAPEHAGTVPSEEWPADENSHRIRALLVDSGERVATAIRGRIEANEDLDRNFTHPLLLLQLLMFHDAYHHGQIKLALKLSGHPIDDEKAGELTWDTWRRR